MNEYEKYLCEENHTPFIQFQLSNPVYDEAVFHTAAKSKKIPVIIDIDNIIDSIFVWFKKNSRKSNNNKTS